MCFAGSLLLAWEQGLGQVREETLHHKVSLVVHKVFQELLFYRTLVKYASPQKPLFKKRTRKEL